MPDRHSVSFHEDHGSFLTSETQSVIIERNDTGAARLNHPDLDIFSKAHFLQAIHEGIVTINVNNAGSFTSSK